MRFVDWLGRFGCGSGTREDDLDRELRAHLELECARADQERIGTGLAASIHIIPG
jgi:hypothetical protein